MKKILIAAALTALVGAASGFMWHEAEAQHRQPPDAPKTGQAAPRPPQAHGEPDRPRQHPRPPIVIPSPGWPWWGYPYPYRYPPYGSWPVEAGWETASVRIDVSPNDAQVYVDSFYAGVVDDFDGLFQHLTIVPGVHLLEIRKTGYVPLAVELSLYPGQTVTYRRTMEPAHGEAPPAALPPGFDEGAALPAPTGPGVTPGEVRFDVSPADAAVYADGFYAGIVDDFNDSQHLLLAPGHHHVSLSLTGYESIEVDLTIEPARTITYRASLKKLH